MENYEQERLLVELFRQLGPTNQRITVDCTRGLLDDQYQAQIEGMFCGDILTDRETERLRQIFTERNLV